MFLIYIKNVIVLPILIFISAVHNLKVESNEKVLLDIAKNITLVNNLLQDLSKKYTLLKNLAYTQKEKISNIAEENSNEFYPWNSEYQMRAKVKIRDSKKLTTTTVHHVNDSSEDSDSTFHEIEKLKKEISVEKDDDLSVSADRLKNPKKITNAFYTDESSENKNYKIMSRQKMKTEMYDINGDLSAESHEKVMITKTTRNKKKGFEQKSNHKEIPFTPNDYSGDEIINDDLNEATNPQDVTKLLVIHLGDPKKPKSIKNRASNKKEVNTQSIRKKHHTKKSSLFKPEVTTEPYLDLEDKKSIEEEMSRAKALRKALGDACTILVNRKCKTALNSVLSDVCKRDRKCKSPFNNDFTKNANAACDEHFNKSNRRGGKKGQEKNGSSDDDDQDYDTRDQDEDQDEEQEDQELTGARFVDYTRQGLLDMTCLQALGVKQAKPVERTNETNIDMKTQYVHILRDKLENACRKASFDKCSKACKSATDKTCKKHECVNEKKKAFDKRCKKRCSEAYDYKKESSSEAESESDEGSDSDSE